VNSTPQIPSRPTPAQPPEIGARLSIVDAAAALARGGLVLIPTETLIGLGAAAPFAKRLRDARRLLAGSAHPSGEAAAPSTWHAPSSAAVRHVLTSSGVRLSEQQRRVMRVLLPGPLTMAIALSSDSAPRVRTALRTQPGDCDDATCVYVRVSASDATRALASALWNGSTPSALLAERLVAPDHAPAGAPALFTRDAALRACAAAGVDLVGILDAPDTIPPTRPSTGQGSTLVRFELDGSVRVAAEGAMARSRIERALVRRVLFVCTGNTCRSPMAMLIARGLSAAPAAAGAPGAVRIEATSAGTSAHDGSPFTRETVDAVEALGIATGPAGELGRSRALTRAMIDEADDIIVMTRAHRAAVLALAPDASAKLRSLDPNAQDVPDPIGGPPSRYQALARTMRSWIAAHLKALREPDDADPPERA
jgi:protein-tyrosine-phosphatase/tRNA A37 threonylcarbamoyladenosine synthetase subunit TsaC/SUA5/YrdC